MIWSEALSRLTAQKLVATRGFAGADTAISQVVQDSRKIGPGSLFVAIKGDQVDGHRFISSAVAQGAVAVVSEQVPDHLPGHIPYAVVHNSRRALAELSAAMCGDPGDQLHMTGITGTNGKTTTGSLVHHVLQQTGTTAGMLGTVSYTTGGATQPATLTTPDAPRLQYLLREMVSSGCTACVMEVSSHSLSQHRVDALAFDVAVFTNLMHDHLNYHGTTTNYFKAKKRLFDSLGHESVAIYNIDDAAGQPIVADSSATRCSFGQAPAAQVRFALVEDSIKGLRMSLDGATYSFRLAGTFNAYNLAAAYAAARATGLEQAPVLEALADAAPPPGRYERFICTDGTSVVLDFAHTPDALEQVLGALRRNLAKDARLWCVFGCGGDRDQAKRPLMGSVAERLADRVIVTTDNPRGEDPDAIAQAILGGMCKESDAICIANRRVAIEQAGLMSAPKDIVLIAGKGHESTQTIGDVVAPFDDRKEIFRAFAHRGLEGAD